MPAAVAIPEGRLKELEEFRRSKCSCFELKRFLCLWLRVNQGMPAFKIADVLGLKANTVRLIQKNFISNGIKVFTGKKKGPKKPRWTTFSEEAAFLEGFVKDAKDASVLIANEIKAAWEKELGRTVHKTTLYRMLKRHGWRKVVPRPKHPKQDKEALESFKKGATKKE